MDFTIHGRHNRFRCFFPMNSEHESQSSYFKMGIVTGILESQGVIARVKLEYGLHGTFRWKLKAAGWIKSGLSPHISDIFSGMFSFNQLRHGLLSGGK